MKRDIKWHENCLRNMEENKKVYAHELELANENFKRITLEIIQYRRQIAEAKKRGKDGFDENKFLKRRK